MSAGFPNARQAFFRFLIPFVSAETCSYPARLSVSFGGASGIEYKSDLEFKKKNRFFVRHDYRRPD